MKRVVRENRGGIATGILLLLLGFSVMQAQVSYNESTGGDLPTVIAGAPDFTVAIGTNTWTGTIEPTGGGSTQDAWDILIPSGMKMTQLTWSGPTHDGGSTYSGFYSLGGAGINYEERNGSGTFTPAGGITGPITLNSLVACDFSASGRSWTVTVTVVSALPVVTSHPSDEYTCGGSSVTFSASASAGTSVQWQVSTNGGTSFADIPSATSTSYTFTPGAGDIGNLYQAVFTNAAGSVTTNSAELLTGVAPTITLHPTTQTVCVGYDLTLSAGASGSPTPPVTWQVSTNGGASFTDIPGATSTTYTVPVELAMNGNRYQAVFTNGCGSVTTSAAIITVNPLPMLDVSLTPQIFTTSGGTMRTVFATVVQSGGCTPVITLESITSSDADAGTGPDDQPNDIQNAALGTDDRQFDLRAEISPLTDDRTYTVTYRVQDGTYSNTFDAHVIVPSGIGALQPGGTNSCGAFIGTLPEMTGPTVTIPYSLLNQTTVRLTIYNTKGKPVYGLVNEVLTPAGSHSVVWDGTNNAGLNPGTQQPNGLYFVLLEGCDDYREVGVLVVNRP